MISLIKCCQSQFRTLKSIYLVAEGAIWFVLCVWLGGAVSHSYQGVMGVHMKCIHALN